MDAEYNDIQQWKFKDLISVFGADPKRSKTYQVKTKQEADDLLKNENFSSAPYLQVSLFQLGPDINADSDSSWSFTCPKKMPRKRLN